MQDKKQQDAAPQQENLSQLLQIRRDKLKELQESGNDPFQITRYVVDIKAEIEKIREQVQNIE